MSQVADKCSEGLRQVYLYGVIIYLLVSIQYVAQEGGSLQTKSLIIPFCEVGQSRIGIPRGSVGEAATVW